jgi:hypothetical protein
MSGSPSARRRGSQSLWQDSGFFQDSFFGSESRSDGGSEFGSLRGAFDPGEPGAAADRSSRTRH